MHENEDVASFMSVVYKVLKELKKENHSSPTK